MMKTYGNKPLQTVGEFELGRLHWAKATVLMGGFLVFAHGHYGERRRAENGRKGSLYGAGCAACRRLSPVAACYRRLPPLISDAYFFWRAFADGHHGGGCRVEWTRVDAMDGVDAGMAIIRGVSPIGRIGLWGKMLAGSPRYAREWARRGGFQHLASQRLTN